MEKKTDGQKKLDEVLKKLDEAEKEFNQKLKEADLGTLIQKEEQRKDA